MSIFKATLKPYLRRQITAKQDLLSIDNRPAYFSKYVSAKSPWVRMVSFVDTSDNSNEPTDTLAKKYILYGGTSYVKEGSKQEETSYALRYGINTPKGAYGNLGDKSKYGTRPMPGIEKVSIKSLSAYGSLKEATVSFYAWDKKQLEDLERLYMRPGYYVLLEWGWSTYLDTNGGISSLKIDQESTASIIDKRISVTDNSIFKNMGSVRNDVFNPNITDDQIYNNLEELRFKHSGNYDGMLGCVRNFSWEFMPNGGYACTTVLISAGEIIDSLKISSATTDNTSGLKQEGTEDKYTPTQFEKILDGLNGVDPNNPFRRKYADTALPLADTGLQSDILRIRKNTLSIKDDTKSGYIQFAYLVHILRIEGNLFDDKQSPIIDIEIPTYSKSNIGNGLCLASEDTVSVDPSKCIIQNSRATFSCGIPSGFSITSEDGKPFKEFLLENTSLGIIGNIYFNLLFVKNTYQALLRNDKKVLLGDFIRELLKTASFLLGDINNFNLFVIDKKVAIIDIAYTEEPSNTRTDKKFLINLSGNNTIVRKSKIQSKIFHSQASMIAIAAQDRENVAAVNTSTNVAFNKGLKHRLKKFNVQTEDAAKADNTVSNIENEKKLLVENIIVFQSYMQNMFNPTKHVDVAASAPSMASILNSIILRLNVDANYRAVIPITLEIEVDGLGGFVIGEIFRVNQDILPVDYNSKNLGFIITQITNNINRADWTTTLTTQICLLDQDDLVKDAVKINKMDYSRMIVAALNKKAQMLYESVLAYNMLAAFVSEFLRGEGDNYPMYVRGRFVKYYADVNIPEPSQPIDYTSPNFIENIENATPKYVFQIENNEGIQIVDRVTNKLAYVKNLALGYKNDDNIDLYIDSFLEDVALIIPHVLSIPEYYSKFLYNLDIDNKVDATEEIWILLHQSLYYNVKGYPYYAVKGKIKGIQGNEYRRDIDFVYTMLEFIIRISTLHISMNSVIKGWFDEQFEKIKTAGLSDSSDYNAYTFPLLKFGDDNLNPNTGEIRSKPVYYTKGLNTKIGHDSSLNNYYDDEQIARQREIDEQRRKSLIGVK